MTQTFGNYQLVKKLATGGMAEVWLAKQTGIEGFNRHVVVKRILPHLAEDPEFVQMFLNEAKIASRFNHPNIAQIYDLGETNGQYFIAMEFIHGEDLGKVMRRAWSTGQWVARHIALRVVADACQGLYYAHTRLDEQGRPLRVVHRDISPQNILISFDGAVKVVDFGIAKASDQVSMTKSGAIKGKFAYMAPEQAAGKPLDARSDLFALGLVLYELATGVRPLKRDSELATLQAALECRIDPPSAVAEVPHELDDIVMRALAKAPDDRYSDAREFQRSIEQFLLNSKELATSVEVSELMGALFADRLNEEARLGTPNPSTESSTNNPIAPSYSASVTQPPPGPPVNPPKNGASPIRANPAMTLDEDALLEPDAPPSDTSDDEGSISIRGGYELPAGTVLPSRRYIRKGGKEAPPAPRRSRPEMTRAGPADDEALEEELADEAPVEEEEAPQRPARRRTSTGAFGVDESPQRRRPSSQFLPRKNSTGAAMPEAPPRKRSRPALPSQRPSGDNISKLVDIEGLRSKQAARLKTLVVALLILSAVGLAFVFRDQLAAVLKQLTEGNTSGPVPVRLIVSTTPPTQVTVVPPPNGTRKPLKLGGTPIIEPQSGAFVYDTVRLENSDMGILYEEEIPYGEPNMLVKIDKRFTTSAVRVIAKPAMRGLTVWRNGLSLGQVGVNIDLYPGKHQLELRGASLKEPVPFEIQFSQGATNFTWDVPIPPEYIEKK